ncbi:hypothetical protein MUP95_01480, partial [bacterium]|nr:hypothetical protein [bacterium]
ISKHRIDLAKELLDDIELVRLKLNELLLKTSRLARLMNDEEIQKWLKFELNGYKSDDPIALKYMDKIKRWTDKKTGYGYWISLSEVDSYILSMSTELNQLNVPNVNFSVSSSNEYEIVTGFAGANISKATQPVQNVLDKMNKLTSNIATLSGIKSRVIGLLHDFITRVYYELQFSSLSETIFENFKHTVDTKLSEIDNEISSKIPAIYNSLTSGDKESISHALTTCRRIINSFADAIYHPTEEKGPEGEDLNAKAYLNRINLYIVKNSSSKSRCQRIKKTLREIHERVCAGVHSDVSIDEAKALFLHTYLILGEISLLKK